MSAGIDDNKFIKKPNVLSTYSAEDIEHMKKCAHPIDGPMYFMENFMMIQHPTRGSLLFDPYEYQRELVKSYHQYRQQISLLGRQLGKCLEKDSVIKVKNKNTGEIREMTIGEFHDLSSK